ncbi:ATPase family AAA domain-containing protein 5-like [Scleropages formosus]|uniref:ATPase family AAA domain-containing protein 5-like n=1 Tax=Scleropages formosus TaxID=113540 RepID=A0A0P7UY28_SCLFO|nr:ATPase family AAA domain-containing protein 5-like [Scleropages formosus]
MASLVAMASVTEDFETQPCKKERKDGETSSVKTITNYFQPVPKPTEKPFSPPKPNNILDYFRKTGSTLEKTDISDLAKENRKSPSELQDCRETAVKSVKIKRLKRSKRLSKKLSFSRGAKDLETEGPSEVIRVSESDFSSDGQLSVGDMKRSSTVFGSDTATFLAQISTEAIDGQESLHDETFIVTDTCSEKKPQENSDRKGSVNQKAKSLLDTTASLESTKSGGKKSKYTKADCKPDAVLPKQDLLKAQEPDRSLSDRNLEANVDKASPLNDSTVTISFEEFLQSQNQDDGSSSFDTSDHINEVSNTTSEEFSSQKVSPRTLTIQAEVHPVSPEHEMVNPRMRQLASIFTRRLVQSGKGSNSKSPSHPWEDADIQPTPKRKSNVVLQEEDLVLAVIEAGSTPKCTQTERKQFMNAFKQPTLEAGKAKLRKGPSKQEAANNKTVMLPEEETLTCKKVSKEEKAQLEDVLFRKKGHNKLQRGGKKKAGEESPLLLPASEEKAVSEGGGKAECPDTAGDHTIAPVETTALRRSTRGRAQEMTSEQSTPTQSPMTRSCNRLKNQQKGKEPSQGSLTVTATPKRHLSKHRMYRVEMLSPPDGNSSPISCDWSENSQDDEHFRARREFLKSGLPESFKKQIARTAASRDAYSTACTSFQPVVHVLQRSPGCPLWNLPWPGSLKQLEKARFDVSKPVLSLGQTHYTKTQPTSRANINKGTGWREEFSEPVRKCLVEEVRASNPQFPVQKFLAWFLKRRAEHLLQCTVSGFMKEDVLWTEKYQPQHSSEVIGNMAAVRKLHSWLKEWKQRADSEEGRNQRDKKRGDNSNDSWDCGDFQGEEALEIGEDPLCNTLLITGPPGVGKTAAVYACAQELGFKVFEVNASSQRSGRQILSQLKEATQSHQVDLQGVGALKPSYFNSQSNSSTRSGTSPRKGNSPGKVVSSPRKVPQSPRRTGHKKNRLAPVSLVSFFKTGSLKEKNPGGEDSCPQKDTSTCSVRPKTKESIIKGKENTNKSLTDKEEVSAEEQSKKTATSLILFEEVNVGSYLQLLCLAENVRVDAQDLFSLLAWKKCDIRQSMLHLQFWVCSGGGRPSAQRLLAPASDIRDDEGVSELTGEAEKPTEEKGSAADPPHCQTGCTESLLGLLNIGSDLDPQEVCKVGLRSSCKSSAEPETQKCWKLLTDSWKRGVDLLYTNMEELLPLPVCILETCSRGPQEAPKQSSLQHHVEVCELSDEASPTKVSSRIRRKRCLSHTDQATPVLDSDTDDDFLSLPKSTQAATISKPEETSDMSTRVLLKHSEEKPPAPEKSSRELNNTELSPEQRRASTLVSCCLESMAEFLDHMSFLDSSLKNQDLEMEGTCRPGALGWIGAEVKSGLTDEPREAHSAGYGQWEEAAEVRAVTESLSFQRCHKEVSEVWVEAQKLEHEVQDKVIERLSLPVALHRKGFSLFESSLCEPRVIQMRGDVLRTTSSRVLSMLGNKPAAAMDYLPSLRTICRSERLKEQGKVKRRFLHYLDGIHLGLPRNTVQILAEDFP